MKFRKLSFLLAIVMLLGILAACSDNSTPTSESPSPSKSAPTESPAETPDEPEPSEEPSGQPPEPSKEEPPAPAPETSPDETGAGALELNYDEPMSIYNHSGVTYDLPLFPGEDVSFSMWVSFQDNMSTFMPNQYADNQAYLRAAELTGVNIDFRTVTTNANTEQFNLMIAGGDYVDIITNVAFLWSGSYDAAIDDEVFIDLTEMVENYMPAYKSYYDTFDEDVIRDLHTDAGYMPRLIGVNYDYAEQSEGMMVRTDYLDIVGLDIPRTYDELDAVLRAFQTEIGMSQPLMLPKGIVPNANNLVSGFDVLGTFSVFPMTSAPWYQVDGEIKFGIVEDGYRDYIEMIAGWYADGIISSEFMVLNDNPMGSVYVAEITSGNAGIFFGESGQINNYVTSGKATNPDYEVWAVPQTVKEVGQVTHFAGKKSPISGRLPGIAVTTSIDDIEKLGKYLDYFFTAEGALLATVGVEGQAWEMSDSGELIYGGGWLDSSLNRGEKPTYFIYSVVPALYPLQTPEEERVEAAIAAGPIWEENIDSAYTLPTVSLTTLENETYSAKFTDIQTYLDENIAKFVVGDRPMSEWDSFVQDVWNMDLQSLIDLYQDALDRYYNR